MALITDLDTCSDAMNQDATTEGVTAELEEALETGYIPTINNLIKDLVETMFSNVKILNGRPIRLSPTAGHGRALSPFSPCMAGHSPLPSLNIKQYSLLSGTVHPWELELEPEPKLESEPGSLLIGSAAVDPVVSPRSLHLQYELPVSIYTTYNCLYCL